MVSNLKKGVKAMADAIEWKSDLSEAQARAKKENKPVLMDFFNPG